jgi:endo-1,4-beta-xylanase
MSGDPPTSQGPRRCRAPKASRGCLRTAALFLVSGAIAFAQIGAPPPHSTLTLRQAAPRRTFLVGAAADADELPWVPDPLNVPEYAFTLGQQYSMMSPENALKWPIVHPAQDVYNFEPANQLTAFAQAHAMQIRGHNLCWYMDNPDWLNAFAAGAQPADMAQLLESHIQTVMSQYRGIVFAWDVVNEAISDSASGIGTDMRDSIWYDQPGIGLSGTGYVEQAFRWARAADPDALLFYNEYGIEDAGPKFEALYNMLQDFVSRGVPVDGVGFQMHVDTTGYPTTAGLTQNIVRIAALGLQVQITEMDVRVPVDSNGQATPADLQAQAETYQRILTVCLQAPACTAFQTWGFSDAYSWIPSYFPGFGAALPFDQNYLAKPAFSAILGALQANAPMSRTVSEVEEPASRASAAPAARPEPAQRPGPPASGLIVPYRVTNQSGAALALK